MIKKFNFLFLIIFFLNRPEDKEVMPKTKNGVHEELIANEIQNKIEQLKNSYLILPNFRSFLIETFELVNNKMNMLESFKGPIEKNCKIKIESETKLGVENIHKTIKEESDKVVKELTNQVTGITTYVGTEKKKIATEVTNQVTGITDYAKIEKKKIADQVSNDLKEIEEITKTQKNKLNTSGEEIEKKAKDLDEKIKNTTLYANEFELKIKTKEDTEFKEIITFAGTEKEKITTEVTNQVTGITAYAEIEKKKINLNLASTEEAYKNAINFQSNIYDLYIDSESLLENEYKKLLDMIENMKIKKNILEQEINNSEGLNSEKNNKKYINLQNDIKFLKYSLLGLASFGAIIVGAVFYFMNKKLNSLKLEE